MTDIEVLRRLDETGIRREADFVVPMNGAQIPLPYMVVRRQETVEESDDGVVSYLAIDWTVALFTTNKDIALERAIRRALAGVQKIEVTSFPDGTPYQTNFEFTTKQTSP